MKNFPTVIEALTHQTVEVTKTIYIVKSNVTEFGVTLTSQKSKLISYQLEAWMGRRRACIYCRGLATRGDACHRIATMRHDRFLHTQQAYVLSAVL